MPITITSTKPLKVGTIYRWREEEPGLPVGDYLIERLVDSDDGVWTYEAEFTYQGWGIHQPAPDV